MCRKLDAAIHKELGYKWDKNKCKICGWTLAKSAKKGCVEGNCSLRPKPHPPAIERVAPFYSTDGNAMLELIGETRRRGWDLTVWSEGDIYYAVFEKTDRPDPYEQEDGDFVVRGIKADALPEAVARAWYKVRTGKEWGE